MRWRFFFATTAYAFLASSQPTIKASPAAPRNGSAQAPSSADRGLALYVHADTKALAGEALPVLVEAYGFPQATKVVLLSHASVDAAWDPAAVAGSIKAGTLTNVHAETDDAGHARLLVTVPDGPPGKISLYITLGAGSRRRTETLQVERLAATSMSLDVAQRELVPRGLISGWARVRRASDNVPLVDRDVRFTLLEGGLLRTTRVVRSDANGIARLTLPVPKGRATATQWMLTAQSEGTTTASVSLRRRDDAPIKPKLVAQFKGALVPGGMAEVVGDLRDGVGEPVSSTEVRFMAVPEGFKVPDDEKAWEKSSESITTDALGHFQARVPVPSVVPPGGLRLHFEGRTRVEGRELRVSAIGSAEREKASATLAAEGGGLFPGLDQNVELVVDVPHVKNMQGTRVIVTGDGVREKVTLDKDGRAVFSWRAPADVGTKRTLGPCSGSVATTVRVQIEGGDLLEECMSVERDAGGFVSVAQAQVEPGTSVHVRVHTKTAALAYSVLLFDGHRGGAVAASWIKGTEGDLAVPNVAPGVYRIVALGPGASSTQRAAGSIVVLPKVRPRLVMTPPAGPISSGATFDLPVLLTDQNGVPLRGDAVVYIGDLNAGQGLSSALAADDRSLYCPLGRDECDAKVDALKLATHLASASSGKSLEGPILQPRATMASHFRESFRSAVRSLEGAVFEASSSPETLKDVSRLRGGAHVFHPEVLGIALGALSSPPTTPGGETIGISDLEAFDRQITYDHVAKRVTRLKLLRALLAMRGTVKNIDRQEPLFRDPDAFLRRMFHDNSVTEEQMLDPWGQPFRFVRDNRNALPFLTLIRGYGLRSAGPDGRFGTGDDIADPFVRVLASKTPYAEAVDEDEVVDAQYRLEVVDASLEAWQATLEKATGTQLGDGGTGTGSGFGSGHGGLGGGGGGRGATVRQGSVAYSGIVAMDPQTIGPDGKAILRVRLPVGETTWRIAVVVSTPSGNTVVEALDVPVSAMLSAQVATGPRWTAGDTAFVPVVFRNRAARDEAVRVVVRPRGVATAVDRTLERTVVVPARGQVETLWQLATKKAGEAELSIAYAGSSGNTGTLLHGWDVAVAGDKNLESTGTMVASESKLEWTKPVGATLWGTPRVVVSRGMSHVLEAALRSLDPDASGSASVSVEALESANRVLASAEKDADLRALAKDMQRRASIRIRATDSPVNAQLKLRALRYLEEDDRRRLGIKTDACPTGTDRSIEMLESEPVSGRVSTDSPASTPRLPCWDVYVNQAVNGSPPGDTHAYIARAILSFVDSPARRPLVAPLVARLESLIAHDVHGGVVVERVMDRSTRVLVLAALAAGTSGPSARPADYVFAILRERDAQGTFGSYAATRAAIRTILGNPLSSPASSKITVVTEFGTIQTSLGPGGEGYIPIDPRAVSAKVRIEGAPLIARFDRPYVQSWATPAPVDGPFGVDVVWPEAVTRNDITSVSIVLKNHRASAAILEAAIAVPPGSVLADAVPGVFLSDGTLFLQRSVAQNDVGTIVVPLRTSIRGTFTIPPPIVTLPDSEEQNVVTPARVLTVK